MEHLPRRHDSQYNDTWHNNIKINDTPHNNIKINDTPHNEHDTQHNDTEHKEQLHYASVVFLCCYAEGHYPGCCYAEGHYPECCYADCRSVLPH